MEATLKRGEGKKSKRVLREGAPESLSRGEHAYKKILESIRNGTLKPGTRMREAELAEWFGSSRTPIREALNRLLTEGLVTQEAKRGLVIAELDHSMMSELYAMREVLEGTAARLAARHATDIEIEMLRGIAERDKEIGDDPVRLAKNNWLFHETLHHAAHNRYLLKMLSILKESMALLGPTTLGLPGRSARAYEEHSTLVAAIERHDADVAEQESREHIRAAYRARIKLRLAQALEV